MPSQRSKYGLTTCGYQKTSFMTQRGKGLYRFNSLSMFCHFNFPSVVTLSYQMTFEPGIEACIPLVTMDRNMYSWSCNLGCIGTRQTYHDKPITHNTPNGTRIWDPTWDKDMTGPSFTTPYMYRVLNIDEPSIKPVVKCYLHQSLRKMCHFIIILQQTVKRRKYLTVLSYR